MKIIAVLLAIVLCLSVIVYIGERWGTKAPDKPDETTADVPSTDPSVTDPEPENPSVTDPPAAEPIPQVLTYTGGDISVGFTYSLDDSVLYRCWYHTTELKANTRYRISWHVDGSLLNYDDLYIPTVDVDEVEYGQMCYDTSFVAGENNVQFYNVKLYERTQGSMEFTSENEGDMFAFSIFEYRAESVDVARSVKDLIASKTIEVTIEEVV